eukprot:TRINITY_DN5344_c0_g1_i2.p1 TRINITY_DN5344_c0_g1~~TRINITY_DN5344_c0_g1_i2.p1  ORF type:complete len:265 (+),score=28.67 TRINITY_DN5344_c0_g1_i2:39-833(+)
METNTYTEKIKQQLNKELSTTSLGFGELRRGKVRDCYVLKSHLLLVTSDRVSAFDRPLANIPFKGQVLTQTSVWWFQKTKHIIKNHFLSSPDPNVLFCKRCIPLPIEMVVRGYITGTTSTSLWTHYAKGVREYCGHQLPEGLRKNQRLDKAIVTPTTKEKEHDRIISPTEIINEGWMTKQQWEFCSSKALELFEYGQKVAQEHGLILVDTKYEFGVDPTTNEIILIDEIHTPDSSRYWFSNSYLEKFNNNQSPESIDKDILRQW